MLGMLGMLGIIGALGTLVTLGIGDAPEKMDPNLGNPKSDKKDVGAPPDDGRVLIPFVKGLVSCRYLLIIPTL
jgi:hypothetical protein